MKSKGLEKSRNLASRLCNEAAEAILQFPDSLAKDALIKLTESVVNRRK